VRDRRAVSPRSSHAQQQSGSQRKSLANTEAWTAPRHVSFDARASQPASFHV